MREWEPTESKKATLEEDIRAFVLFEVEWTQERSKELYVECERVAACEVERRKKAKTDTNAGGDKSAPKELSDSSKGTDHTPLSLDCISPPSLTTHAPPNGRKHRPHWSSKQVARDKATSTHLKTKGRKSAHPFAIALTAIDYEDSIGGPPTTQGRKRRSKKAPSIDREGIVENN